LTAAQPDRLDRIEATLDAVGQRLDQIAVVAAENTKRFTELAEAMLRLSESQLRTNRNVDLVIARIDEMQSEVRGLQTENRRILDRLLPE
jgi:septal ring factor EnvC (AmiA/AmiB activator)